MLRNLGTHKQTNTHDLTHPPVHAPIPFTVHTWIISTRIILIKRANRQYGEGPAVCGGASIEVMAAPHLTRYPTHLSHFATTSPVGHFDASAPKFKFIIRLSQRTETFIFQTVAQTVKDD